MNANLIVALVVGGIMVIIGLSLWPILTSASDGLKSYFTDSCDDGAGNRYTRVYQQVTGTTTPSAQQYNTDTQRAGGSGVKLSGSGGNCQGTFTSALAATDKLVNEHGEIVDSAAAAAEAQTVESPSKWIRVDDMLRRFSGINNLLLGIMPIVSIGGFLGISGANLISYSRGMGSIGSSITASVFTLIGIVVAMVIASPIMGSLVDAHQVVASGQYDITGTFGGILGIIFSMIPIVYVAGLVTLVAMQARSALMGSR